MGKGKVLLLLFLANDFGITAYAQAKIDFDLCLTQRTKISSRWVMDGSINVKTKRLLEENVGQYLCDLRRAKGCSHRSEKAITIKCKGQ